MIVGVPRETYPGERRVALVPIVIPNLAKAGMEIIVEAGAGAAAGFPDAEYAAKGAKIVADRAQLFAAADIITQMLSYGSNDQTGRADFPLFPRNQVLIGFLRPMGSLETIQEIAASGVISFSVELMPRTTRAQSMDALSSMGTICGYKAVLIASDTLPKFFPMLTTAAGTIAPAKVLVIGAGVAGLQAIATSRRLGAVVTAYDTRTVVAEQVKSLGAKFLEIDVGESGEGQGGYAKELSPEAIAKQRAAMVKAIGASDVVITTAAIPGKRAPILVTAEAVAAMAPGSVIIDLAAETGGNVEGTKSNEIVTTPNGVTIVGLLNPPSSLAFDASRLYARNVQAPLDYITKDGPLALDPDDEIVAGTTLTRDGEIVYGPTRAALTGGAA